MSALIHDNNDCELSNKKRTKLVHVML